ncbi:MAG: SDR family oxidoreductase [Alphaproteobacteria bacterium]|nr:SDR family oxidoreductase [Alphaproteobacteria bacterium SS10]
MPPSDTPSTADTASDNLAEDHGTLVITGGSRGIGAACARLAARRGYDVAILFAKDEAAAEAVVADCNAAGVHALAVQGDVSDPNHVTKLFKTAAEDLGPVRALINNAGITAPQGPFESYTVDRMQRVFATNIMGAFLTAQEAVRHMAKRNGGQGGAIVNVSSASARLGSPNEYIDYAASKGAMDTMTIGMAKELAGEGIRVNAVRPGIIDTEIHALSGQPDRADELAPVLPMGRAGSAEEVAEPILWLLSDEASYMSGALLDIAGAR